MKHERNKERLVVEKAEKAGEGKSGMWFFTEPEPE